jgi:hypothetical protein
MTRTRSGKPRPTKATIDHPTPEPGELDWSTTETRPTKAVIRGETPAIGEVSFGSARSRTRGSRKPAERPAAASPAGRIDSAGRTDPAGRIDPAGGLGPSGAGGPAAAGLAGAADADNSAGAAGVSGLSGPAGGTGLRGVADGADPAKAAGTAGPARAHAGRSGGAAPAAARPPVIGPAVEPNWAVAENEPAVARTGRRRSPTGRVPAGLGATVADGAAHGGPPDPAHGGRIRTAGGEYLLAVARDVAPDETSTPLVEVDAQARLVWAYGFGLIVRRRFEPDSPLAEISRTVAAAVREHALAALPPLDAEMLVRAALGEQVPIDGIEATVLHGVHLLLFASLADELALDDGELDDLVAEAEARAGVQ